MSVVRGKTVLITGANSGVGFEAARALAGQGAAILMVCRNQERGQAALEEIKRNAAGPPPVLLLADIASQVSVRKLVAEVRSRNDRIDVLINNAGGVFSKRELTGDGIEKTFATNHLGSFLLTNLLLDSIGARGRIINVASEVYPSMLDFRNLQGERSYNFLSAYFRSKLENIVFTFSLARRIEAKSVTVNCLSPGPARTRFGDDLTGFAGLFPKVMKAFFPSAEQAAQTLIYLASSAEVAGVSGRFFMKKRPAATKPVARDSRVGRRLWAISAGLVGLQACEQQEPSMETTR